MILLIDAHNANQFGDVLHDMHRDRRKVFVDGLGWNLPVTADGLEIDQFDGGPAVYLVCVDPATRRHMSSTRLLPSTAPHVLGSVFDHLCDSGAPRTETVWEISRFCTSPGLTRDETKWARRRVVVAMAEFALLHDLDRYSCVISLSWLSVFLSPGWRCDPLGAPKEWEGDMIGAFSIAIGEGFLPAYRAQYDVPEDILIPQNRRAA